MSTSPAPRTVNVELPAHLVDRFQHVSEQTGIRVEALVRIAACRGAGEAVIEAKEHARRRRRRPPG